MTHTALRRVAVCVVTRQRLQHLETALTALRDQHTPRHPDVIIEVHVVDNDSAGTARELVTRLAATHPHRLSYALAPTPGVAQARNVAVARTRDADAVVLLDDDERPASGWLDELLTVQQHYGADAVGGPVLPEPGVTAPSWLREGRFLETPRHRPRTGEQVSELGAGNVLVTRRLLDAFDGPFDPRFDHTGGEDSVLFRAAHRRGFTLVWADDAVVWETVPSQRLTLRWVLRRGFREGSIVMRRSRLLAERPVVVETARALVVLALGALTALSGAARGRKVTAVSGLRRAADGAGRLAALAGRYPEPYR